MKELIEDVFENENLLKVLNSLKKPNEGIYSNRENEIFKIYAREENGNEEYLGLVRTEIKNEKRNWYFEPKKLYVDPSQRKFS